MSTSAICAETQIPSVSAAKNVASPPSESITRNRPSWNENSWMSSRPIRKFGTERNSDGNARSAGPNGRGRYCAPNAMPKARTTATASAAVARTSVDGSTSRMRSDTGRLDRSDRPRSPIRNRDSEFHSWTSTGWSRP